MVALLPLGSLPCPIQIENQLGFVRVSAVWWGNPQKMKTWMVKAVNKPNQPLSDTFYAGTDYLMDSNVLDTNIWIPVQNCVIQYFCNLLQLFLVCIHPQILFSPTVWNTRISFKINHGIKASIC